MNPHGMSRGKFKTFCTIGFLDMLKSIGAGYGKTSLGYA
jgi:hypothetical protein